MKKLLVFILLLFSITAFTQQGEYILAENYFRNNQFNKAIQLYEKLVKKSPYNTTYLQRLIACYQETNNFIKAENLLKNKLHKQPNLTHINVLLGYNLERQHQLEKAQEYYNIAIKSIEKDVSYGEIIANTFKNYNKLDFVITAYKIIESKRPTANYGFQKAQIYGEKGDFKKMFDAYISLVDKNSNYVRTVKSYTAKYINDDSENENNILFKKALLRRSASNPKNEWNNLLSWLFTKQKEYKKALIQQKALYARNPNNLSKIKELGKIAYENNNFEQAKECFDFFIEKTNHPKEKFDAISMNLLIAIKTKQTDVENQFSTTFEKYGINSNTFQIQMVYADYLTFEKNKPKEAEKVLEKALSFAKTRYSKANVKLKLAEVLVYKGKFNKALIYFSQVQSRLKNHYLGQKARFKVAQTSYFKGDFDWAKAQLKVLKGSATQLIANDAAHLFLIISDNQPKDSMPTGLAKFAKADLLAYQNKNNEAITILDTVITNFKGQGIEDEALFKQAELFIKNKNINKAILNYNKIIAIDEKGILIDDVYYQMAEIYNNELNNTEKAKEYYQKIIFDYPSSIYLVDARKKYRKLRGDSVQ